VGAIGVFISVLFFIVTALAFFLIPPLLFTRCGIVGLGVLVLRRDRRCLRRASPRLR
jgi:hypothetical protein